MSQKIQGDDVEIWHDHWGRDDTPWNLEGPHPYLVDLYDFARHDGQFKDHAKVLVPGCGHGHDAKAFALWGAQVVGQDIVPKAIERAKELGQVPGLSFEVGDALVVKPQEQQAFDAIYDRAFLCAIPPKARRLYLEQCAKKLKGEGLFLGILFSKTSEDSGPPFEISIEALMSLIDGLFTFATIQERPPAHKSRVILQEGLVVLKKCKEQVAHDEDL